MNDADRLRTELAARTQEVEALRHRLTETERLVRQLQHQSRLQALRAITRAVVPAEATIVVVSRGDDDLLRVCTGQAWHFPRTERGEFAGYHPRDSREAQDHLDDLRSRGASYFLLPGSAYWWLDFYADFFGWLRHTCEIAWSDQHGIVYRLTPRKKALGARTSAAPTARRGRPRRRTVPPLDVAPAALFHASARDTALDRHRRYEQITQHLHAVVRDQVPRGATVLVVSRGDARLVQFDEYRGWHFPRAESGVYSGFHPADDRAAIEHLEALREQGAEVIVFPATGFWWFTHYQAFRRHLDSTYLRIWNDDDCVVYRLADRIEPPQQMTGDAPPQAVGPAVIRTATARYDVICLPIIDWDFRFQRPQQLATQFARAGHRVFYARTTFSPASDEVRWTALQDGVFDVQLPGPASLRVYQDAFDASSLEVCLDALDAFRRTAGINEAVCLVDLPFWAPLALEARRRWGWRCVYDWMDDHAGFSTNGPRMLEHEQSLVRESDLVVSSAALLHQAASTAARRALLLPNAADFEHFSRTPPRVRAAGEPPVIGYFGAISDWFDADLVADLAERRPDWRFVLVGATFGADLSRLSGLANVSLPGEQPYHTIPDWLRTFDVTILPFRRTRLTEATNPVKAYEILAAGRPLVSVPLPEMVAMTPLVRLASSADEFEQEIGAALADAAPHLEDARRAFAAANTWRHRFETLAPAIAETFPKVSIVIVTFHNLALNRLCLETLYERTDYPNVEVIVVDNGSTDGTPAYLREAQGRFPDLQVVLHDANRGFAAANNAGLALATGEYLVLLNNDTVVTRGWLSALLRHLQADARLGLVGPVTNAIGNEAQIEVGYGTLDDLPAWASSYTAEHAGQSFTIPMLAMFCVAMRRDVFERIGPLDERFGTGMFEDDDYCQRLRDAGYGIRCAQDAFVHHWQKSSFALLGDAEYLRIFGENRRKFMRKWDTPRHAGGTRPWTPSDLYADQLAAIKDRLRRCRGAVIMLPSVGWNIHLFQRPHHLARAWARLGYLVIFDGSNASDDVQGFAEIEPNLFLYRGPEAVLHQVPDPVLWALPYNYDYAQDYPDGTRVIYDWIDDLEIFPYDRDFLHRTHARALQTATVVASVAGRLHEEALRHRPDALYLPNAVEYERFADDDVARPDDPDVAFARDGRPVLGYYGALAEWFDYDLVDAVAALRPDWHILLIGPMYDRSLEGQSLLRRNNVRWIGPRNYHTLPGYLRLFDVACIPFRINPITLATSPLKMYEYMAGGIPVVTTPMPECQAVPEVRTVADAASFVAALDEALRQGRDPEFRARLRARARAHTWTVRVEAVLEHMAQGGLSSEVSGHGVATAVAAATDGGGQPMSARGPEGADRLR